MYILAGDICLLSDSGVRFQFSKLFQMNFNKYLWKHYRGPFLECIKGSVWTNGQIPQIYKVVYIYVKQQLKVFSDASKYAGHGRTLE